MKPKKMRVRVSNEDIHMKQFDGTKIEYIEGHKSRTLINVFMRALGEDTI
jgi:hypothetical protein